MDIAEVDMDGIDDFFHIEEVSSQAGYHIIDNRHLRPPFNQPGRQIGPNKTQSTCHQYLLSSENLLVRSHSLSPF
jgi:hypothetical protein